MYNLARWKHVPVGLKKHFENTAFTYGSVSGSAYRPLIYFSSTNGGMRTSHAEYGSMPGSAGRLIDFSDTTGSVHTSRGERLLSPFTISNTLSTGSGYDYWSFLRHDNKGTQHSWKMCSVQMLGRVEA